MERILRARELLESHTPMKSDCGALCGGACCKGSDEDGMALLPGEAARTQEVDEEQAASLLRGETLPSDARGWVLATYRGMPLGWGKASSGQLKNHIPKGLRRPR